jgi:hypothetical protein
MSNATALLCTIHGASIHDVEGAVEAPDAGECRRGDIPRR